MSTKAVNHTKVYEKKISTPVFLNPPGKVRDSFKSNLMRMQKDHTRLCYKNACVSMQGKAAEAINSVLLVGVVVLVLAAIVKAIR
jgi:hypothetical protein